MARVADFLAPEVKARFPENTLDFRARHILGMPLPDDASDAERALVSSALSEWLPNMTIASQAGMQSSHGQTMRDRESYRRQPLPMRLMEQAGAGGLATLPSFSERVNRTPHTPEPTSSAERIARGVGSGLVFGLEAAPIALTGGALGLPALATGAAAAGIPAALQAGTKKQRAIRGGVMAATGGTIGAVAKGAGAVAGPVAEKATHLVGGPVAFGAAAPWAEYGISKVLGEDVVAPTARDIAEGMVGLGILGAASSVGARGTSKPGPATPKAEAARQEVSPLSQPKPISEAIVEIGAGLDASRPIPFAGKRTAAALYKERIASIPPDATPEQARAIAARARREVQSVQEVDDALRPPKTEASPDLLAAGRRIQERADAELVGKKVAVRTEGGPAVAEVAAVRVYPYPDVEMKARLILRDPVTDQLFVQSYRDVAEMTKALSDPASVDWASQGLGEGVKSETGAATPETTGMPQAGKGGVLASPLEAGPAGAVGGGNVTSGQLGAAEAEAGGFGGQLAKAEAASSQAAGSRATASEAGSAARSPEGGPAPAVTSGPGQTAAGRGPGVSTADRVPGPGDAKKALRYDSATGRYAVHPEATEADLVAGIKKTNRTLKATTSKVAMRKLERIRDRMQSRLKELRAAERPMRPAMDRFRADVKLVSEREQSIFEKIGMERSAETAQAGVNDLARLWHRTVTSGVEMLNRQGEPGKKLGADIGKAIDFTQENAGRDIAEMKRLGQGLTNAEKEAVGKLLDGSATDPRLQPIAEKVRALTDRILSAGQEVGLQERTGERDLVPLRRMENWFRQVLKDEVRSKVLRAGTPENERQIEWMREQDPTLEVKEARRALSDWMNLPGQIRAGLQHERAFTIAPEFREWNFEKVLADYALNSWKRIAQARQFGANDAKAHELIQRMANEGGDAKAAADVFVGFVAPWRGELSGLNRALSSIHAITMLSTAGILQPSQMTNTAARTSFLHALRGYAEVLNGIVAGKLELHGKIGPTEAARRKAATEWADETGVAITETVQDIVARESKSLAGRHVRLIGLEPLDRINRLSTAVASRLWARDLAAKLKRDPTNEAVKRDLRRVGLDPERVAAEGVMPAELRRIARQISGETQFESGVLDLPSFRSSGSLGKVIYRFKSFAMQQARLAKNLTKEAFDREHPNPAPLIRFLIGQATINPVFGEIVAFVRRKKRPDSLTRRWLEDMMLVSALGAFGDVARAAASGGERFASTILGPTFGELFRFAPEAWQALPGTKGNWRPLVKHVISRTPLLGPQLADWLVPKKKAA